MTNWAYKRDALPSLGDLPPGTMLISSQKDPQQNYSKKTFRLGDVILCDEADGSCTYFEIVPSRGVDNSLARGYVFEQPLCLLWMDSTVVDHLRLCPERIETIGQLVSKTRRQLLNIPGFSREYLDIVTKALEKRCLRLGMKVPTSNT